MCAVSKCSSGNFSSGKRVINRAVNMARQKGHEINKP